MKKTWDLNFSVILHLGTNGFNEPLLHNVPTWSDTLPKSCSKSCKTFAVYLTILGYYASKAL